MKFCQRGVLAIPVTALLLVAACAQGTNGIDIVQAPGVVEPSYWNNASGLIRIASVNVRPITLPDLSATSDFSDVVDSELTDFFAPVEGVERTSAACEETGGQLIYADDAQPDQPGPIDDSEEDVAFSIQPGGAGELYTADDDNRIWLITPGDGTGNYVSESTSSSVSIEVDEAGVGRYYRRDGDELLTVDVSDDGSGTYYQRSEEFLMTVTLNPDGSAELFERSPRALLTISANADGSGELFRETPYEHATVLVRSDGSWEQGRESIDRSSSLQVDADGSGSYLDRGEQPIAVDFDAAGEYPNGTVELPIRPLFDVAAAFPDLGSLSALKPRCATVLRLDTQLLFEFGEHRLRADAKEVLVDLAIALNDHGKAIEVTGHTDAIGDDADNVALSMLRAEAVRDALVTYGLDVDTEIAGLGEAQPIAPNELEDGSDNPAGRAKNRRVEVVIRDADISENS